MIAFLINTKYGLFVQLGPLVKIGEPSQLPLILKEGFTLGFLRTPPKGVEITTKLTFYLKKGIFTYPKPNTFETSVVPDIGKRIQRRAIFYNHQTYRFISGRHQRVHLKSHRVMRSESVWILEETSWTEDYPLGLLKHIPMQDHLETNEVFARTFLKAVQQEQARKHMWPT